jgi:hypothetical protein
MDEISIKKVKWCRLATEISSQDEEAGMAVLKKE